MATNDYDNENKGDVARTDIGPSDSLPEDSIDGIPDGDNGAEEADSLADNNPAEIESAEELPAQQQGAAPADVPVVETVDGEADEIRLDATQPAEAIDEGETSVIEVLPTVEETAVQPMVPEPTEGREGDDYDIPGEPTAVANDAIAVGSNAVADMVKRLLSTNAGRIGLGAVAAALALAVLFGTHVICFHEWSEPSCTEPATCSICGRTQGEALGHDWQEATCTKPQTCSRCQATEGKALGHSVTKWEATTEPTCTKAGVESGKCDRCGETQTRELPMVAHEFGDWKTTKEATCTSEGESTRECKECGKTETKAISMIDHTPSDWKVVKDVSVTKSGDVIDGKRARVCTVCGAELESEPYTISVSTSQKNALRSAASYLSFTAFSYSGLVHQLEYEGFSNEDATFAADHCGADWREQALKSAKSYLSFAAFSHDGLVHQLEYEGYSTDDAVYAADNCGADWNEQAAKSAKSYLNFMGFSRDGLIDQLMYEGFTYDQAVYGVDAVGL